LISAAGDHTSIAAKQAVAARVPGAEVVVVPNTHHALPLEAPAAFNLR
jgi:pimeloyl-ACP methyl ester carboxylesterase